jgi:hypothetical protein
MRRHSSIIAAAVVLGAVASFAVASLGRTPHQSPKQFVLLMKATGPDFFAKTQEP